MQKLIKIQITLNQELCISCGVCSALHSKAFEPDSKTNKYKVTPKYQVIKVTQQELEQLQQVAQACPVQAIKIKIIKNGNVN